MSEFDELWEHFLSDKLNEDERQQLQQLLRTKNRQITEAIDKMLIDKDLTGLAQADREHVLLERVLSHPSVKKPAIVRLIRRHWAWAAASIVFLFLAAAIVLHPAIQNNPVPLAPIAAKQDIPPGHQGAVLTLSNGKKIVLDSAGNGTLTSDNKVTVVKKDGRLTYEGNSEELLYNTVSTPNGRQWELTLGDGTKVWLNAASSIRYPISFASDRRRIEVTGEAYLEVTPNASSPFIVATPTQEIHVLGTHFNVNAYSNEPILRTTLLEGSVKVKSGEKSVILHPGEQAANHSGDLIISKVEVNNDIAWISGRFKFDHSDIPTIMRQIARWYDVEVEYRGPLPAYRFSGGTFRSNNLSEVLQVLELSGSHFKQENRKIIVMP